MNCRPGDLAVIVHSAAGNHGRFVEVVDAEIHGLPGSEALCMPAPMWHVRAIGAPIVSDLKMPASDFAFPDAWLRPIRDPGPDAVDETLRELEAA